MPRDIGQCHLGPAIGRPIVSAVYRRYPRAQKAGISWLWTESVDQVSGGNRSLLRRDRWHDLGKEGTSRLSKRQRGSFEAKVKKGFWKAPSAFAYHCLGGDRLLTYTLTLRRHGILRLRPGLPALPVSGRSRTATVHFPQTHCAKLVYE